MNCATCGIEFIRTSNRQIYCENCTKYRGKAVCKNCQKEFNKKSGSTNQYCCRDCCYEHRSRDDMKRKNCPICDKVFKPKRIGQTTCSHECNKNKKESKRIRICCVCEKQFDYYKNRHKITCGRECAGILRRKGPMYSFCERCGEKIVRTGDRYKRFCSDKCKSKPYGSKRINTSGYAMIKVGGDEGHRGWMLEHRYVMEQHLGRKLEQEERIHHKNGNRQDNRLENLELWTIGKKDPAGQRQIDVLMDNFYKLSTEDKAEIIRRLLQNENQLVRDILLGNNE